jgi:hypothetical protein
VALSPLFLSMVVRRRLGPGFITERGDYDVAACSETLTFC